MPRRSLPRDISECNRQTSGIAHVEVLGLGGDERSVSSREEMESREWY